MVVKLVVDSVVLLADYWVVSLGVQKVAHLAGQMADLMVAKLDVKMVEYLALR